MEDLESSSEYGAYGQTSSERDTPSEANKRPLPKPRQLNREELEALRARLAHRDHNRRG